MSNDSAERSIRVRQTIRIVLWVVIVASAAVGAVLGYLTRWRRD